MARARQPRTLCATVKCLDFVLYTVESHWRIVRKDFLKLSLVVVWRMIWKGIRLKTGKSGGDTTSCVAFSKSHSLSEL